MNLKDLFSITLILFSVIDIVGSVPIIIDLKRKGFKIEPAKASIVALILMSMFLYLGDAILKLFGVDSQSFAVAGSIIIFFIGLEMILGITLFKEEDSNHKSGTLVPLVFPLIAGAGTMTTIISLNSKYDNLSIQLGIILNILLVFAVLKSLGWIQRTLGEGGTAVLRKIFGIILLAIAVKMFKENFHLIIAPAQVEALTSSGFLSTHG